LLPSSILALQFPKTELFTFPLVPCFIHYQVQHSLDPSLHL
jgi:hypothetical protein